ncbi:hypothetical protein CAEBREN_32821 [Caenorhabditis brenneri]|uniref:Uncharacterized protein n=1 Tax=Caenorhabditis brenneri TaxID=135651 RepID=G0N715_CAEBE|nr:hypothetical protein CAEBREN_32821 [Caenorhabditis brenneri]
MKLVLAVIFVVTSITAVLSDVQCGNNKFCRIGFKQIAQNLAIFANKKIIGIKNFEEGPMIISVKAELCNDDTIGFLLDENVSDYVVSCVWTGVSQLGQCRAVPPKYFNQTYQYVEGKEWRKKLQKVYTALGCGILSEDHLRSNAISVSKNPTMYNASFHDRSYELFICNDRCVQGGIGYVVSIIILLTLAVSFFKNCVEVVN